MGSIYVSFALQQRQRDGTIQTIRDRLSCFISAIGLSALYCRFGFPDIFRGPVWVYLLIAFVLFSLVSALIKELNQNERSPIQPQ